FETATGTVRLIDLLPVQDGIFPMGPMREVLRIIEGLSGEVDLAIWIDVRPDYGRCTPVLQNRGRLGWYWMWRNEVLVLRADLALDHSAGGIGGTFAIRAGDRTYLSLSYTRNDPAVLPMLGR